MKCESIVAGECISEMRGMQADIVMRAGTLSVSNT